MSENRVSSATVEPTNGAESAAGEWLPIETAPKDGTCILACTDYQIGDVIQWWTDMKGGSESCWIRRAGSPTPQGRPCFEPRYWMPIKAPPVGVYIGNILRV